jgi:hypothetical protein
MQENSKTGRPRKAKLIGVTRANKIKWASIAIISATLSLSAWALSSPIGSAPDDDYHNVSIWCGQGLREGLCEQGSEENLVLVRETLKSNSFCFAGKASVSGQCEQTEALGETSRTNRGENPRIYYWVTSWFASNDIAASVLSIRVFNSILVVTVLSSVVLLIPRHLRRIPIVAMLATSMPLGMFIIASTNPSAWAATSVILFFTAFLGFLATRDKSSRIKLGLLAALGALMAAGSRPDSAFYILIALGAAMAIVFTKKLINKTNVLLATLFLAIASVFFVTSGNTFATLSGAPGGGLSVTTIGKFFLNLVHLPNLWVGVFGTQGLGWMDTLMPSSVWAVTYGIFFFIVFSAIKYMDPRQWLAFGLVFFSLIAVPIAALSASGLVVGDFIQPRYLLPLLGLLVATAMFRRSDKYGFELSKYQAWLIGAGLFVGQVISLQINLRRYLTGLNVNDEIEWWWVDVPETTTIFWFSPDYVLLVGSLSFGLLLVSLWKLRQELGLPGANFNLVLENSSASRIDESTPPVSSSASGTTSYSDTKPKRDLNL